jgi:hypothetical protein
MDLSREIFGFFPRFKNKGFSTKNGNSCPAIKISQKTGKAVGGMVKK